MININIKSTGLDLTDAIRNYVNEKISMLEKVIDSDKQAQIDVEVGRTTEHHHSGDVYRCEINVTIDGDFTRAVAKQEDLYAAIDVAKDDIAEQLREKKNRKTSDTRKEQRSFKRMLRRFWRNEN